MADLGRRTFLTGTGVAAGLWAGCRPGRDPYAPDKPVVPLAPGTRLGAESYVLSTCGMCDTGCGIRVRVVDGRAVKVEGNPASPVNRGGLCARGLAGLEMLYHPDRIRGPMHRHGNRGDQQWEAISWNDAIGELRARLEKLRASGDTPRLVLVDGESRGTTHALWARFLTAFGSPNHLGHSATGRAAVVETLRAMTGKAGLPGYDFERAACVLLVGTGALESSPQAMHLSRALAAPTRPRMLCASPRLPKTAALVDEWLAVAPGRAGALLLGLLHVLLREQLADESAIEKSAGFEAVRSRVMTAYSPAQAAQAAGVAPNRIETLARELVATRPSVVVVDEETKDAVAVAAALVLNAVLSSIGGPGGMLLEAGESVGFSPPDLDERAWAGLAAATIDGRAPGQRSFETSRILAVPDAILSGKPYPVEVLLLHYSNPVFSKPDGRRWAEAIAKVPFVVSFSPILDESARFADLLFPEASFLERWDVVAPTRGSGALSLRQPVVAPLATAMQTGDVVLRLAAALGESVAKSFPWKTYREAVLARLAASSGDADGLLDDLASNGVCKAGGKGDAADGTFAGLLDVTPVLAEKDAPKVGEPVQFPFALCPFRDRGYAEGGVRQFSWLAELPGGGDPWRSCVEMAPEDAVKLGVADGDWVAVTSPVVRVELRVRIHPRIKLGVLGLPLGGWGRVVGDSSGTPARLLAGLADPSTGQWLAWATRAKVGIIG